jgi:hypothetical protein
MKMATVNFMRAMKILAVKATITARFVLNAAVVKSSITLFSEFLHGDQIGGPRQIDRGPCRNHHPLTLGHPTLLEGGGDPLAHDLIDVGEFGDQDGVHTPGEDELPDGGELGTKGEDGIAGSISGDQSGRPSGTGRCNDGSHSQVLGQVAGGMTYGIGDLPFLIRIGGKKYFVGKALLRRLSDRRHEPHRLNRIFPHGGLF